MRLESAEKHVFLKSGGLEESGISHVMSAGRLLIAILGIILLITPAISFADDPLADAGVKKKKVRLFETVEFKSSLRALPQWVRVMERAGRQVEQFNSCRYEACSPAAMSWQRIIGTAGEQPPMEQLSMVNAFFNQWPYRLDIEIFGVSDYWATPEEFMKLSGDCEDYSIAKYYALKHLGFKKDRLRIVVLRDLIRNIGHAVLAVYIDDTAYILDNLTNLVLSHEKYKHYLPQYSVNEESRWAHVKPVGN